MTHPTQFIYLDNGYFVSTLTQDVPLGNKMTYYNRRLGPIKQRKSTIISRMVDKFFRILFGYKGNK